MDATVTVRAANGAKGQAAADYVVYGPGARYGRAAAFIVVGLVLGTMCTIVPGPHMFVTFWLFPGLGIWLGVRAFKADSRVYSVKGPCPACGETLELLGGPLSAARTCRHCDATLELIADDAGDAGAGPSESARS